MIILDVSYSMLKKKETIEERVKQLEDIIEKYTLELETLAEMLKTIHAVYY